MTKDDIVTIVLINGAEIIGKFVQETDQHVIIHKPRMVQVTQEGMGMVPGVCMTGEVPNSNFHFNKHGVLFVIKTVEQLAAQYQSMTSNIIVPQSKGLIQ